MQLNRKRNSPFLNIFLKNKIFLIYFYYNYKYNTRDRPPDYSQHNYKYVCEQQKHVVLVNSFRQDIVFFQRLYFVLVTHIYPRGEGWHHMVL